MNSKRAEISCGLGQPFASIKHLLVFKIPHALKMAELPTILIVGTLDTKLSENLYLRLAIVQEGRCQTKVLDVGRTQELNADALAMLQDDVLRPSSANIDQFGSLSRGDYVNKVIEACTPIVKDLVANNRIQGIISAAGSTGSSIATALMRNACPVGFPKLMISTMASGDIKPYIEETDITMMYSVVDIAGINSILERILSNGAAAITGMAYAAQTLAVEPKGKRIAITMFGVTTPCVDHIRKILSGPAHESSEYEIYVFHATGSGGKAMERLIDEGQIDAVIDLTTTEIADELFGGVLTAGPDRLDAAMRKGIPTIVSTGACDMVNFGPKESVPENYRERNLYVHNPTVTLMRTTKENNHQIGKFIATKLQAAKIPSNVRVLLPTGGVSMLDKPDQPFHDPQADRELFEAIVDGLKDSKVEIFQCPENVNDETFAAELCKHLLEVVGIDPRQHRLANDRRRKWSFDHGRTLHAVRRASQIQIPDA